MHRISPFILVSTILITQLALLTCYSYEISLLKIPHILLWGGLVPISDNLSYYSSTLLLNQTGELPVFVSRRPLVAIFLSPFLHSAEGDPLIASILLIGVFALLSTLLIYQVFIHYGPLTAIALLLLLDHFSFSSKMREGGALGYC